MNMGCFVGMELTESGIQIFNAWCTTPKKSEWPEKEKRRREEMKEER